MAKKGKFSTFLQYVIIILKINCYLIVPCIFDVTNANNNLSENIQIKNISSINVNLLLTTSTTYTTIPVTIISNTTTSIPITTVQTNVNHVNEVTAAALRSDYGGSFSKCTISEFKCDNNNCINANKFCNQINDCGDNSDEPMHCTRKYHSIKILFTVFRLLFIQV